MEGSKEQLDPAKLTLEQLVRILRAAGSQQVAPESIEKDVESGAPRNADGTINLVHYAAWLVKEMGRRGN